MSTPVVAGASAMVSPKVQDACKRGTSPNSGYLRESWLGFRLETILYESRSSLLSEDSMSLLVQYCS